MEYLLLLSNVSWPASEGLTKATIVIRRDCVKLIKLVNLSRFRQTGKVGKRAVRLWVHFLEFLRRLACQILQMPYRFYKPYAFEILPPGHESNRLLESPMLMKQLVFRIIRTLQKFRESEDISCLCFPKDHGMPVLALLSAISTRLQLPVCIFESVLGIFTRRIRVWGYHKAGSRAVLFCDVLVTGKHTKHLVHQLQSQFKMKVVAVVALYSPSRVGKIMEETDYPIPVLSIDWHDLSNVQPRGFDYTIPSRHELEETESIPSSTTEEGMRKNSRGEISFDPVLPDDINEWKPAPKEARFEITRQYFAWLSSEPTRAHIDTKSLIRRLTEEHVRHARRRDKMR